MDDRPIVDGSTVASDPTADGERTSVPPTQEAVTCTVVFTARTCTSAVVTDCGATAWQAAIAPFGRVPSEQVVWTGVVLPGSTTVGLVTATSPVLAITYVQTTRSPTSAPRVRRVSVIAPITDTCSDGAPTSTTALPVLSTVLGSVVVAVAVADTSARPGAAVAAT